MHFMNRRLCCVLLALVPALGCANHAKQSIALYEHGDYAGAARAADEGLASHPDDDALWGMRVRAALAQGDAAGVAKAYASARSHRRGDDVGLLRDLAIATLGQAIASPSVKLKVAAIEAIEAAQIQDLAEEVGEHLGDNDDQVAAAAAIAVLRGFPQAPQVAEDLLRSEDPEARRIIIDGLGRKIGKLALADLEKAANDPDVRVRRVAIRWLGQLADADAVEILTRRLRDPDETVRAASARALARIGRGNLEPLGTRALEDRQLAVRLAGIELLVAAKRTDSLGVIAESDRDPMVAAEAAIALKRVDLAAKALDRAAHADTWTIRAGAANVAVRALGTEGGRAFALRLLADKEPAVRLAAARVLAHAGDRATAAPVFAEALANPELALQAAADLADQGDARGTAALDAAVRDLTRGADRRAAAAAAHRGAHVVTPGLVAALADPSAIVRVEAAAAIVTIAK